MRARSALRLRIIAWVLLLLWATPVGATEGPESRFFWQPSVRIRA